ncbi:MAG TPA: glycosyltransferase [Planctomycetota bacterium]|nr:glycosyltransferase [Planctomycetota bacterium]
MFVDELSIVLPAYNEAARLPAALRQTLAWSEARRADLGRVDVLVVDDGSTDATGALVQREFSGCVRLVPRPRRGGKGAALRTGIEAVRTPWLCFIDADASIPVDQIDALLARADRAPLVIGSKRAPGSRLRYPVSRRVLGAVGQRLIRLLVVEGFHDTQCGLKLMRTDVARQIAHAGRVDGFGFDFEFLLLARRLGHPVVEVPIRCEHRVGGSIHAATYLGVLRELALVVANRVRGVYPRADGRDAVASRSA